MISLRSYRVAAAAVICLTSSTVFAQGSGNVDLTTTQTADAVNDGWKPSLVKDGVYDRQAHSMSTLTWQPVREADIMWKKRIWREIDTRELQNQGFRYPGDENSGGGYFIEILLDAVKKGKVKAYSNYDDRFTKALSEEAIKEALSGKDDSTEVYDPVTNTTKIMVTHKEFDPESITKYRVKEDWIFDRNLGRMVVRIIGIAPIMDVRDPTTQEIRGQSPLFWLYYPESRDVLSQYEVFSDKNDVQRMTWDDFFEGRFFSSRIIKISNPYDQYIKANPSVSEMEALYMSQQNTDLIFTKEHDMWVY